MEMIIGGVVVAFVVSGALLRSPQGNIWALIFQLQMYYFLVFIGVEYPQHALIIMRGFSFSTLGLINRLPAQLAPLLFDDLHDFSLGLQFTDNGLTSTLFSKLYEPKTAVFLAICAFSFAVALPCSRFCRDRPRLRHLFSLCSGFNFWARLLLLFYFELAFFLFIGTYNLGFSPALHLLATLHCLAVLLIISTLPFLLTFSLMSKAPQIARARNKWKHNIFVS